MWCQWQIGFDVVADGTVVGFSSPEPSDMIYTLINAVVRCVKYDLTLIFIDRM